MLFLWLEVFLSHVGSRKLPNPSPLAGLNTLTMIPSMAKADTEGVLYIGELGGQFGVFQGDDNFVALKGFWPIVTSAFRIWQRLLRSRYRG